MAHAASPSPDQSTRQTANPQLVPPDERFWKRYSPHSEFSLSSAGSLAIHILIFGLLGLMAWLGAVLFTHASRSLPVEAVRLDLGGGGGSTHGKGDGPNNGAQPVEDSGPTQENTAETAPSEAPRTPQEIKAPTGPQLAPKFDDKSFRFLQQTQTDQAQSFQKLSDVTSRIRVPDSGRGQGGTGKGGGSGEGDGTGVGKGQGPGHASLTQREKRMLRWIMGFNSVDSEDYLRQLQSLGAILAVPVQEHAKREEYQPKDYRLIRDLSTRPPKLLEEDITQLHRIYWFDDNPRSAASVMSVLRLTLEPSHFIAFMPEELEQKLYKLENEYLQKRYKGRHEDDITETKFELSNRGGKYEPKVKELKLKKK